jgi:hypothetical protein
MLQSYASSDANALNGLDHTHKDERPCWWVPARRSYSDDRVVLIKVVSHGSQKRTRLARVRSSGGFSLFSTVSRQITLYRPGGSIYGPPRHSPCMVIIVGWPAGWGHTLLVAAETYWPSSLQLYHAFATGLTAPYRWNFRLGRRMSTSIKSTLA